MRNGIAFAAALIFAAAPANAIQKLGARTVPAEQLLDELGAGVSDAELARAVADASRHPLGTTENPVRVGGPEGQRAYLGRLRCADGSLPKIGAKTAGGVGAYGTVVDAYPVDCGPVAPGSFRLVMDMYHAEHEEDRAPAGFRIESR